MLQVVVPAKGKPVLEETRVLLGRESNLKQRTQNPPESGGSVSRKVPLARVKFRSFRTAGFPELRVSIRLPLGHPVTAPRSQPGPEGRWRFVRGF